MFFLIRTAFWVSLLLLVLPIGGGSKGDGPSAGDRASIDAMSAFAAAGATISDVTGFCQRQPDACAVGGQALKLVGERARESASLLSDYFGQDGKNADTPAAEIKTGSAHSAAASAAKPAAVPASAPGRQTLSASDRKTAWRGPDA